MNPSGIDANEPLAHRSSELPLKYLERYALAALSVGVALGASLFLKRFHFRVPSALLLLFAVAISSWYGGQGPAVLAVILSTIGFYWYFVEPVRTLYIYRSDIPYFIIFTAFAALLSWFGTVRRRGEADLREQAALLNLTHDTVFMMDMEGAIKYWNRGAEERYGWTADQAVGKVVHDLLKTVFPAPLEEIKAEVTRTGRWEGELLHTKKDGSQLVAASRWSLERGKRGEPVAILETNNDITERKQAEETLRRLNRELRAISNCNQVLLRASDEQSLLEEICRIVCEDAGYRMAWVGYAERDEAKSVRPVAWAGTEEGYLAFANITWADTDRGRGPTGTALRSGKSCCVQDFAADPRLAPWRESLLQRGFRSGIALPLKDKDGNAFGCLTIHSAQPNAFTPEEIRLLEELAGDMAFGIVTLRSRAARKQAEQALRQSEGELRQLVDVIPQHVVVLDPDGEFCYVNRRDLEYTGLTLKDVHAADYPARIFHPNDWERLRYERQHAIAQGIPWEAEARLLGKDGQYRWFLIRLNPLRDEQGHIIRWYGTRTDIEGRKQAEAELRESQATLAHVTRLTTIGELTASIAHEINQPLSGVVSNGSACLRWLAGDRPNLEEARDAARRIVRDGKRAGDIIARVRALARKADAAAAKLDLNETIGEVLALVMDESKRNNVVIKTDFADDLSPVPGDRVQLQQVILNLAMNGIEAMSAVEERPRELVITTQDAEADQVRVTVRDSGSGLDPQSIERLFEPFYTTKREGVGMGLSISRTIIQNHGGAAVGGSK